MFHKAARTLAFLLTTMGFLTVLALAGVGARTLTKGNLATFDKAESCEPARWLGMEVSSLEALLGSPAQCVLLPGQSGEMVFYTQAGKCHYVFETNRRNKVAVVHARLSDGSTSPQFATVSAAGF